MPHETTSTYTFGYRLVIGTDTKLEYEVSSGNWQLTSGHGDTFLNRVPPNSTTDFDLEFSGKASDGTPLTIEGSYTMGGTTYTFGPSSRGSDLTVTISNQVTCAAPVQHFAFTVKGTDANNKSYEYDPLMIMAANGGSCTEN